MSLVFYITPRSVRIQKHRLEFALSLPPENLTQAARGAYALLRQSVSTQTDSSREEREEALNLLKHYGQALFETIIPPSLRSHINKEGSIFIYSVYPAIINLPWELLFDGSSFFALTQGVIRINESKPSLFSPIQKRKKGILEVALNAYTPLLPAQKHPQDEEKFPLGNRFISPVEEFPNETLLDSGNVRFQVAGNASRESLLMALKREPDIFFFSGYHSSNGWVVDRENENSADLNWFRCEFQPALKSAAEKGLKLLILNTSNLVDTKPNGSQPTIGGYFDQGIPYIITISGRIARHRLKLYFQSFIYGITQGENILKAHRHALNKINISLPLAWDWSWIQLHINKRFLENNAELPTSSFDIQSQTDKIPAHLFFNDNTLISNHRRFTGSYGLLKKITDALLETEKKSIYSLELLNGFYQEEYLQEFFRRQAAEKRFNLSVLYYNEYRTKNHPDPKVEIGRRQFSSLYDIIDLNQYYDESLIHVCKNLDRIKNNRYLIIYYPPKEVDQGFDHWLQIKLEEGWKIIALPAEKLATTLPNTRFQSKPATFTELISAFEDTLPENWIKILGNGLPKQMENIALLWIVKNFNSPYLIDLFCSNQSSHVLWESTFSTIIPKLSVNRLKIFMTLLLLKGKCSNTLLAHLFPEHKIQSDLDYLNHIHLIDQNLKGSHYWVPTHIIENIWKYQLISKSKIEEAALEILQRYTSILDRYNTPEKTELLGFQAVVNTLLQLEVVEEPLLRLLQFCKKLRSQVEQFPIVFIRKLLMILEISLVKNEQIPFKKILCDIAEILEKLPYISQTIDIYRWLLKKEEKQKNWQNVAELQKKIALIFVRVDEKEKAIGLLTSAIQLNKDIKSFAYRYNNLISIALLLVDIGESDKVAKLVNNTNFDVDILSKENIDRLWLIDGHLLYAEKKYKEALQSFSKISDLFKINIEDSLRAKSFLYLSELYALEGMTLKSLQCKNNAADFFIRSGQDHLALKLYQSLYEYYTRTEDTVTALRYLEMLFELFIRKDDKVKIQETAHELGGLYFKTGDNSKSTQFYKIAQSI